MNYRIMIQVLPLQGEQNVMLNCQWTKPFWLGLNKLLLEAETMMLKKLKEATTKPQHFHISNNDDLVRFYAGFVSYMVFEAFFEFLGQ